MDYMLLKDFLTAYSLPTVIIAFAVGCVYLITDKFLHKKIPVLIGAYAPFLLSVVTHVIFDMVFTYHSFTFYTTSLYAGLLSGSLASIFISAVKKIASGKPLPLSAAALLIEGLIAGYVESNAVSQTARALENIIQDNTNESEITSKMTDVIKNNAHKSFAEDELLSLALLIVKAVKALDAN